MNQIKYVHTADIARKVDYQAINEIKIPSMVLMEHAAMEATNIIIQKIRENSRISILCGPGNNGGDGLAIARLLNEKGISSNIYVPSLEKMSVDEKYQYDILSNLSIECIDSIETIIQEIKYSDFVIDCLFGNGISRDITGDYQQLIEAINDSPAYVFSIDVPSGLQATTGKILNVCVKADETIALDCFKNGFFINDGNEVCGKITCVHIGIPQALHKKYPTYYIDKSLVQDILPKRSDFSHKGTYKKALMIGGSQSMHGAITLAAKACYMSGIGTLTLMIPESIGDILAKKMEFAMNLRVKDRNGFMDFEEYLKIENELDKYGLISIGNGMGQNQNTVKIVESVLKKEIPTIVDADAIWALGQNIDLLKRNTPIIVTPHIKEMSYLCKKSTREILSDPFTILDEFIKLYPSVVVVLKSSTTIISSKQGTYVLNEPNSALAKGGSGDILCGIITGISGQTDEYLKAAVCGAYIHSQSAKKDIDPASYQPEDCIQEIPNVFKKIRVA